MNIIELQDRLKDLPDRALMQEMQMPTGNMPQFLVLSELTRRRRMRDEYNRQMAADMPTVAEEVMTAAGAPQGGITAIARNMAPNSSIAQNTGADMAVQREPTRMPQKMAEGGVLRLNQGFKLSSGTSISDQLLPGRISTVLSGGMGNANERMVIAEQVLRGVYGPELQSQFTSNMLEGSYGDDLKNIAEQFNVLTNQEETSINSVPTEIDDFAPTIDFNASDRGFEPTNIAPVAAVAETFQLPTANIDADQQISYQSGKEPFRRFGANYYNALMSAQGNEMKGDRDRIMATAGEIFPFYLEEINKQFNTPSSSVVASEPELSMADLMAQAQIEREGFGAGIAAEAPAESSLQNDLADALQFAVDADERTEMMARLEEIDTPPPSVLGAQTDNTSGITTASRRADREKEGFLDFFPTFGSTGEGRGRDYQVTMGDPLEIPKNIEELIPPINQETEDRQVRRSSSVIDNLVDAGFTGGDIDPSDVPTQIAGTPLEIPSEEEGGIESLLPTLLGDDDSGTTGNVGSGAPSGGDAYTKLESRIAKMLDDREKSAESDKFLALAQAGLALMASDSPTLGGAIGEAGLVGISQLREARNQYDKDILGLLSTQADIDAARSDAALAKRRLDLESRGLDLEEAALDTTGMKPGDLLDYLANLNTQQTNLTKQLSENLVEDPDERNDVRNRIIVNELEIERVKRLLGYGSSTEDLAD